MWGCTPDFHTCGFKPCGEVERSLPAKLNNDSDWLLTVNHIQYMFQCERLEIQAVGGVVIGGDRLRIAVIHDGFISHLGQRKGRLTTTVIEFDPLTDTIGSAAQDQNLLPVCWARFILQFVGAIEVRSLRFEFRRTGVHALEGWEN